MTRIIWKKIREEVRGILLSRPFVSSPSSLPTTRRLRATRATTGSIRQRTAYRPSRDLEAHESYNVALLCDDRYQCPRRGMASGVPRLGSVSRSFTRQPRRRLLELPLAGEKHRCVCVIRNGIHQLSRTRAQFAGKRLGNRHLTSSEAFPARLIF